MIICNFYRDTIYHATDSASGASMAQGLNARPARFPASSNDANPPRGDYDAPCGGSFDLVPYPLYVCSIWLRLELECCPSDLANSNAPARKIGRAAFEFA